MSEKKEDEDVIGNGNEARNQRMAEIADKADELRAGEIVDVEDADHERLDEVVEEAVEVKAEALPQKRKFKVNGKEVEYSDDEISALVQKGQSADEKYQEAARLKREAEELRAKPPVKTDVSQDVDTDYVALARALQMGSEEEAVAALQKIARPSVKSDDVARMVDERVSGRLSFEAQKNKFLDEYKDVMGDQKWSAVLLDLEELSALKGEAPGYDRMKKAGDRVREMMKAAPQASTQQKLERKASLTVVSKASTRQEAPADEDKDESTQDTIASMAKARGQRIVLGNV